MENASSHATRLATLILTFTIALSCNGCSSKHDVATWNYWQALRTIDKQGIQIDDQLKVAKTPDEASSTLRAAAKTMRDMASEMGSLPVHNVDEEVTAFASEYVEMLNQAASLSSDAANFVDETKSVIDYSNSFGGGLVAFVRGFFGDPLGAYYDTKAQLDRLEERRESIIERMVALEDRTNKIEAKEIALRTMLAERYDREFPPFDD